MAATITYNGQEITLEEGKTLILNCADKVFSSNIVANGAALNVLYNGSILVNIADGQTLELKCVRQKARSNIQMVAVAATTYELSGKWQFNDRPEQPATNISQDVSFYAAGVQQNATVEYTRIEFKENTNGNIAIRFDRDGFSRSIYTFGVSSTASDEWLIFIGTQTVSKEFYEWFTANATQTA